MRRYLLCLLLAVGLIPQASAQAPERLTLGMTEFPSDMHPFISNLLVRNYLLAVSRRSVTRFDFSGLTVCQLCTEVPTVENGRAKVTKNADGTDGMEVRFTLRPGLKWGDNTPLTASDIAFGYEVEKAFQPPVSVTGVQVIDPQNYVVKMKSPRYDFNRLSPQPFPEHLEGAIFRAASDPLDYGKKSLFNRAPETPGLWNGPYLLTSFKSNESVTFVPNPLWDGVKPVFKSVTMRFIENTSALQANLLSGDIDMVYGLTFDQALDLSKRRADKFDISFIPGIPTTWIYVQTENPLLADKRVRQAILSGIDRKTLTERLFEGKQPVANSIISPVEISYNKDIKPWPYDPAKARALLAEAGFKPGPDGIMVKADGTRLSIDLLVSSGIRMVELIQQVVQSQLKQVGIEIVAKSEPVRVLLGETVRKRSFTGLTSFTWTPAPDAIPYFTYHSSRIPTAANSYGGTNYTGFRNARMDELLDAALAELDTAKRRVMFNEIQAIVMEELPQMPLYHVSNVFVSPKWMTGLTPPQSTALPTLWIEYWKGK
jgi:peptide/nickel transport system substrate-binding protein